MVNDLVDDGETSDDSIQGESLEDRVKEVLIRQVTDLIAEPAVFLLPRYYELFTQLPNDSALSRSPDACDIPGMFRSATGFDYASFLAMGFGVLSKYISVRRYDTSGYVMIPSRYFRRTAVESETANKVFAFLGTDRNKLRSAHRQTYRTGLGEPFDQTYLRQRPLLKVKRATYVPSTPQRVVERITSGAYWDIHDSLAEAPKQRFQRFFGQLVERYVQRVFERMIPTPGLTTQRLFCDIGYAGRRSSDVIVMYPDSAVFLDVTVGRLRMERTIVTGSLREFRNDIRSKIVSKAGQIDRNISNFRSGLLSLQGYAPATISRFFPIIVTASPLPLVSILYDEVRQLVNSEGLLQQDGVQQLEIVSLEELELLETVVLAGTSFVDTLRGKQSSAMYNRFPMKTYLHQTTRPAGGWQNNHLMSVRETMFAEVRGFLFPRAYE